MTFQSPLRLSHIGSARTLGHLCPLAAPPDPMLYRLNFRDTVGNTKMLYTLWIGAVMGVGGTIAMDLWALALNRVFGQGLPNWGNVGRWVSTLGKGKVFHDDIDAVPPVPNERAIGWIFHYAVGLIYGVIFVMLAGAAWLAAPTFVPVWLFALVTIAGGWFLLHPGLGLGWAVSKTPTPWKARGMGLIAHTWFGLGMFAVALAVS